MAYRFSGIIVARTTAIVFVIIIASLRRDIGVGRLPAFSQERSTAPYGMLTCVAAAPEGGGSPQHKGRRCHKDRAQEALALLSNGMGGPGRRRPAVATLDAGDLQQLSLAASMTDINSVSAMHALCGGAPEIVPWSRSQLIDSCQGNN